MIEGTRESCALPLLSKSGVYMPVETKIYHGHWNNEDVLIGISRNLSELSISEEKFFWVFEHNQAMMAISEIETGIFVNVNKAFLDKLGYTKEEEIGHSSKDLGILYNYEQRKYLLHRYKNDTSVENEYVIVYNKNKKPIHCLFSVSIIKIQTYNYMLTSAIDISALKRTEEKQKKT